MADCEVADAPAKFKSRVWQYFGFENIIDNNGITVSHFSYAPLFEGPHFLTKMLESNILYENLFIDI